MAYLKPSTSAVSTRGRVLNPGNAYDGAPGDTSSYAHVSSIVYNNSYGPSYCTFSGFQDVGPLTNAVVNISWEGTQSTPGVYSGFTVVAILVNGVQVASDVYGDGDINSGTLSYSLPSGTLASAVSVRAYAAASKYLHDTLIPGEPADYDYDYEDCTVNIFDIWMTYSLPMPTVTSGTTSTKLGNALILYGSFWGITGAQVVTNNGSWPVTPSVSGDHTSLTFTLPTAVLPNSGGGIRIDVTNDTGTTSYNGCTVLLPTMSSAGPSPTGTNPVFTITGSNFESNVDSVQVTLPNSSSTVANNFTVVNDTTIANASFTGLPEGALALKVYAKNGTFSSQTVTIVAPPSISSNHSGSYLLGETINILGDHFHNITSVTSSNLGSLSYNRVSDTQLQVTAQKNIGVVTITTVGGSVGTGAITVQTPTVSIAAHTQNVTVGNSIDLDASVSGAADGSVSWSIVSGPGSVQSNGGVVIVNGAGTITVRATSNADSSRSDSTTITGLAVPTASLTAAKTTVTTGTGTTLTPTFTGGSGSIDQSIGSATSGNSYPTGNLTASKTYTLTATNAAGTSRTSAVTVNVVAAPVASSITASTSTVPYGGSTTITPSFTGGTGKVNGTNVTSGVGVSTGNLTSNTTYTLVVTNAANDTDSEATTVTVLQPTMSAVGVTPTSANFGAGSISTSVTVYDAVDTSVSWGGDLPLSSPGVFSNITLPNGVETAGSGTTSYRDYNLTAYSNAKPSVSSTGSVRLWAVPRIAGATVSNISQASYGSVPFGTRPNIVLDPTAWFNGDASLYVNGSYLQGLSLNSAVLGAPLTAPTTYMMKVVSQNGTEATKSWSFTPLTVVVSALSYSVAAGNYVGTNQDVALSTNVTGAADPGVTWNQTGGVTTPTGTTTATWKAPTNPGSYTVTAASISDPSKTQSATFNVVPPPVITSFTQNPASPVLYGQTVTMTPVFSGQVGKVSGGKIAAGGDWSTPNVSGIDVTYPNVTTSIHTVLSVKNEVGLVVYQEVDITVQPVTMTPLVGAYVEAGQQHQFTTAVAGAANTGVNWSCTGGTITMDGLWTAPSLFGNYTITATSKATNTVSTSAVAKVPLQREFIVKKLSATVSSN